MSKHSESSFASNPPRNQFNLSAAELTGMAKRLRRHVITMVSAAGSGHPGGSLSAADIVAALYFRVLRYRPENPHWPERDRFILSKGHAAPILYAALAEAGYFPVSELATLRRLDSRLQGHADGKSTPGVEMSSGSLGMGLSFAVGVSMAARLDSMACRTYALLSDGECQEGQTWEAALSAAHFKLDNLVAIVDYNGIQLSGWTRDIMKLEPFADKWQAFGWHIVDIDGHDVGQILSACQKAEEVRGRPTVIIAHTVKGKGVSFMENNVAFHGKAPNRDETEKALKELE
ncbi:MAG: transketolase [Dehalococcoidia bacterium]|nr:transketolase [Dehalococcoidia bacterium]